MNSSLVLIVEDNKDSMFLLQELLLQVGYQVIGAEDGHQAIEQLRSLKPDLVLTDLTMPKMSGLELISWIKLSPKLSRLPIVAMSADGESLKQAKRLGVNAVIEKPLDIWQLLPALSQCIDLTEDRRTQQSDN